MNNLRIDFGFGVQIKADGTPLAQSDRTNGLLRIRTAAVDSFGGGTLYSTQGDWFDPETGKTFSEEGATLSVLVDSRVESVMVNILIESLATTIKSALQQKCVYVTRCPVQSELY